MNIRVKQARQVQPRSYENTDGRPSWSPDGSKVAAELGRDVVIMNREGQSIQNKLGPEGAWTTSPDWSPDGKKIVYSTYTRHRDYPVSSWGIYESSPDGSEPKLLTVDGWEPEYNPQGTRVAFHLQKFHTPDRIAVMDADGKNMRPINRGGSLQRDLSWAPGGEQVVYDTIQGSAYQIRITDITGKKDRRITDGDAGRYIDKNPEWSPDGKQILFERHDKRFPVNGVWVVDPKTKKEKQLVQGFQRNLDATWSPDGSKIAFTSNRDGGGDLDIYVMDADGKNITQVSDMPGHEHAPSWSPDGKALAFNRFDFEAPREQQNSLHIEELQQGSDRGA